MFLTPASQLAIVGASSNTMLKIIAKGDEATPKAVSKELGLLAIQTATIVAAQKAWQTIVSKRLLNPFNQAFAAIAIPVVIGGVTSYIIDEDEGLQNYFEFLDVATDPEQTDQATLLTAWSLGTIWKFYTGGGQNKKEGFFEFEN